MSYFALDVETANADYSSICQVGIVHFKDGEIIDRWSTLVNPEAFFDSFNVSIHGITEKDVRDAPTFDVIYRSIAERITDNITVHHMPFDKVAITRACLEYNLDILQPRWLDSAKIARRTWEQFAYKGYGLANIAKYLGIEFGHHDALEDAIAAAKIVNHACEQTQLSIEDWLVRVGQPIYTNLGSSTTIKLDGNPEGSFYGENLVFTGALSLPRKDVGKIAADIGCNVTDSVSKKTSILVVGIQDATKLAGYAKSSKHRKVEHLIQKGASIKILTEKDFIEMCNNENSGLQLEAHKPDKNPQKPTKEEQPAESSTTTTTTEIEVLADKINKYWDNLSDETKAAFHEANLEHQKLLDSIKDCSREEKRALGREFKSIIEKIESYYEKYDIESFEEDEIDVISTIEMGISQLQDVIFDFIKDKMSLAEFFKAVHDSLEDIENDFEQDDFPAPVTKYSAIVIKKLDKIKDRVLRQTNIG